MQPPVLVTGGVVYNEGVRLAICDIFAIKRRRTALGGKREPVVSAAGIAACACHGKLASTGNTRSAGRWRMREQNSSCRDMTTKEALHRTRPLRGGEKLWLGIDVGSTSTNLDADGED